MNSIKEIVAELFPTAKNGEDKQEDIASRINKEIVKFKRNKMNCNAILLGRKEVEEVKKLKDAPDPKSLGRDVATFTIRAVPVDQDSYFMGATIFDESEK
jgi:hypothetical protein